MQGFYYERCRERKKVEVMNQEERRSEAVAEEILDDAEEGGMESYMRRAIELAKKGAGWCNPNPKVGAVIVKDGRIIGEGYHARYGQLHAERNAIASLTESAEGATMYVTLEPCCHYGQTPPCTDAIIEAGIRKVVIGSSDPNPLVSGKGAEILRQAGISVITDFLDEECDALNPFFFHYITEKRPYVIMKYAMTADGKIATKAGLSRWVSGPDARHYVHELRNDCMAIMVGIGTALADDPMLNCRLAGGHQPIRIICDSKLRLPLDSQLVRTAEDYENDTYVIAALPTLPKGEIRCAKHDGYLLEDDSVLPIEMSKLKRECSGTLAKKIRALNERSVKVFNFPDTGGRVHLPMLMAELGKREIDSVLLEGGATLNEDALRAGIVDRVEIFLAPKVFGGRAKTPVEGFGIEYPKDAYALRFVDMELLGDDIHITCDIDHLHPEEEEEEEEE